MCHAEVDRHLSDVLMNAEVAFWDITLNDREDIALHGCTSRFGGNRRYEPSRYCSTGLLMMSVLIFVNA